MGKMRECGWCKDIGHDKRSCEVYHGLRKLVWLETIAGRRNMLEAMAANGLGLGALVKTYNYANEVTVLLMQQEENIPGWRFHNFKNIKYSKAVKATTYSLSNDAYESFRFTGLHMEDSRETTFHFNYGCLMEGGANVNDSYRGWGTLDVVAPSDSPYRYSDEDLKKNILIPKRLATQRELDAVNSWQPILIESELKL
jgi:hypothetical protein